MNEVTGASLAPLPDDSHLLRPLTELVNRSPDRPLFSVLVDGAHRHTTAAEFWELVRGVARGLVASGVGPGDRVALMASTRLEWLVADYAILTAGGVTVPIYDTSSAEQVQWIVSDSGAVLLVVESQATRAATDPIRSDMPECREVLVIDDGAIPELQRRGVDVADSVLDERLATLNADAVATVIYTSGTTGRPKGCVLTHRNLAVNARQSAVAVDPALRGDEVGLLFLPLAHVLTKGYALFCIEHGIRTVFATSVTKLAEELPLARPTVIAAVPRIFEKVFEGARQKAAADGKGKIFDKAAEIAVAWSQQRTEGHVRFTTALGHRVFDKLVYGKIRKAFGDDLRFAFSGGGPLGERLTHFFAGVGIDIYEGYGLTETSPTLTISCPGAWKPGTVGRPVAGTTIRIADDGEILASGPQVFVGYWNNPAATDDTVRDGWFHTGDVGELDAEGYLRITGRKKELIVTAAGKNVAPAPLEDRLRAAPLVSQAVVVGEGRPFVSALVTIDEVAFGHWAVSNDRAGMSVSELVDDDELRAEVRAAVDAANASVSRAESIREFVILPNELTIEADELTPTLKVRRGVVEKSYAAAIDRVYGA